MRSAPLAAVLVALTAASPAAAAPAKTAAVDFRRAVPGQRSMVGLLHGLRQTWPPDPLIAPLRPAIWRGVPGTVHFRRAAAAGAQPMMMLSDLWGYPSRRWFGNGPPYGNPGKWADVVRRAAHRVRGFHVSFDIWNEPDNPYFWTGTPQQFAETFALAERTLRAELGPNITIVGPSLMRFDRRWLRDFLERCLKLGCRVDALSWHEFPGPNATIGSIERHLREARRELLAEPRYRRLGIDGLIVNETVSPADQRRPGELAAYLAALERGGATAAARGCFWLTTESNGCTDETLSGLLTSGGQVRTTPSWWVTRIYGDGVARRARTTSATGELAAIASRCASEAEPAVVLLGSGGRSPARRHTWTVRLDGVRALRCAPGRRVTVRALSVPERGGQGLAAPITRSIERRRIDGAGGITVDLPGVPAHDAIVLEVGGR